MAYQPFRCPVCNGKGLVPNGFYSFEPSRSSVYVSAETCRTCQGTGILWGPADPPQTQPKCITITDDPAGTETPWWIVPSKGPTSSHEYIYPYEGSSVSHASFDPSIEITFTAT